MDGFKSLSDILDNEEKEFIAENTAKLHKVGVSGYYLSLAGREKSDPIRRQFVPDKRELNILPYEKADPLCEENFKKGRKIIKRYKDRLLFLVTSKCAMYCRHCFRRYHAGSESEDADEKDVEELCNLVSCDSSIYEVLLSGGDPLMLADSRLEYIIKSLRRTRPDLMIRIGTRIPVVLPSRITDPLLSVLSENLPVSVFTQFNHYRELTQESIKALGKIQQCGVPVFNQTVLLKGINDDTYILEKLFHSLVSVGVKPYYLFQGDLAAGTSHFRTSLKKGIKIMEKLSINMSGLSLPVYAVDLPDGGGKTRLHSSSVISEENGFLKIKNTEGRVCFYPDEV